MQPYDALMAKKKAGNPGLSEEAAARVMALFLKTLREDYGNSRAAMARALRRSPSAISQLADEHGNRPSLETAERLAKLKGVSLASLIDGAPSPETQVERALPQVLREIMSRPRADGGRLGEWTELTVETVAKTFAYGGAELTQEKALQLGDSYQATAAMAGVKAPVARGLVDDYVAEIAKRKGKKGRG
ncbi:MAG: helix-turn-helix transcriptional regulator [Polyangiaceae bacterium]|nr:helix-turn-helix transcriptional regulator [Polyangiaceae bacterium]